MFRFPVNGLGVSVPRLSPVKLIQGSSRDEVSQTFWTDAREPAALLQMTLVGIAAIDRAGFGAGRSQPSWLAGKFFTISICSAAKLFTTARSSMQGPRETLLRRLRLTLETVSATMGLIVVGSG
jgi:hypothetical protein